MVEHDEAGMTGVEYIDEGTENRLGARLRLDLDTKGEPRIPFQFYDQITVEEDGEMFSSRIQDLGGRYLRRGRLNHGQIDEIRSRLEQWESAGFPSPSASGDIRLRLDYKLQHLRWKEGATLPQELESIVCWLTETIQLIPPDNKPFP